MGRITSTVGALALVLTLALAGSASADTCHIDGPGDWNFGQSWNCGHVPGPGGQRVRQPGRPSDRDREPAGRARVADDLRQREDRLQQRGGAARRRHDGAHGSINGEGSLTVEDTFVKDRSPEAASARSTS